MKFRFLTLILGLLLGTSLFSEVQAQNFTIYADSVQGNQGTQIVVPVRANDFVNLIGAQGSVTWTTSIATFDTVFQFGLPSMGPGSFGISQTTSGRLTFSWDDINLTGVTLADSAVLFAIRFDIVGVPGSSTPVSFSSSPTQLEFTDNTFSVIPYSTNNGQIAVSIGTSCLISGLSTGQQIACNPATNNYGQEIIVNYFNAPATGSLVVNGQTFPITSSPQSIFLSGLPSNGQPVNVTASFTATPACSRTETALFTAPTACSRVLIFGDSVQSAPLTQVTVPIRVKQFNSLVGAQGTIQWNTAVATYDTVLNFGLPGMAAANFGLAQINAGQLTFSWDDNTLQGVTLPDSTIIFAIRYDVVGNQGDVTPIQFVNAPTTIEFTNNAFAVVGYDTIPGEIEIPITGCLITNLQASTQTACDPNTNTYTQQVTVTFANAPATGNLSVNGQIFPLGSSPQTVTLTGLPSTGQPVSISALFTADSTCVLTDPGLYNAPATCADFRIFADSVQGAPASQVIVPVRVENFFALVSAQGSIVWDTAIATLDTIIQYGLPNLAPASFGLTQAPGGTVTFSWDDSTFTGVTVPDSTVIFALQFDVVGNQGQSTPVRFANTPALLEFTNASLSVIGYDTTAGEIEIPITSCVVLDLSAGLQGACDSVTNTYTQQVIVTYSNEPASGNLVVNGQSFPITTSPQTVTLTGLPSFGLSVDATAFFTADSACVRTETAQWNAPLPCAGFRIFADSVQGAPATQVIVPVRVEKFINLVSAQGSIAWDTTVATLDTIFQFGLPNLAPASFGLGQAVGGLITFSWDDSTTTGLSVPDSTAIFGMRFNVVGTQGMQTPVRFVNSPTQLEFTDGGFSVIAYDTTPGEIDIPITGCVVLDLDPGFQFPCDPNNNTFGQEIIVTYANAPASGSLVVNGQSFPITNSPQAVILTGQVSNGQPVDVSAFFNADSTCIRTETALFTASAPCGTFILIGDSVQGTTGSQVIVPIRVKNFDDIIGAQGTIEWDLAVATYDTVFQYGLPGMAPGNFGLTMVNNGTFTFSWDDQTLLGVNLPDSAIIFAIRYNVVGGPGSVTPVAFVNGATPLEFTDNAFNVLAYDTISGEIEVPIVGCAITDLQPALQGACDSVTNTYTQEVIVTYQSNPASGTLIVNGQSFPVTTSPQTVTLTGLPANGLTVNSTAYFSVDTTCFRTEYALFTAPVNCLSTLLTIFGDSVIAASGTQVIVPIRVRNFVDMIGAQGSIEWNTAIATYDTVIQYGLPGMGPANFGTTQTAAGRLAFSWDDNTLQGVTLADSTQIFGIRFDVIGPIGTQTPVRFLNSPTVLEFTDNFFVVQPYDTIPGEIRIPVAEIFTDSIPNTFICAGDTIQVSFTVNGVYNTGNVFSAELSDALGSFAAPITIGSVTGTTGGTITVVIPYVPSGSAYRIRVVSSNPIVVGSDNGVDLTISNIQTISNVAICEGDSIFLDGAFQTMSGSFGDTLTAANSCDSLVTTILTVIQPVRDTVAATICDGDSIFVGGGFQTLAGTYVDTMVAASSCDSILTTLLSVQALSRDTVLASICEGDSIQVGGGFQTLAGFYTDTLASGNGCDSLVTTDLSVIPTVRDTVATAICDGDSLFVGGGFQTLAGAYVDTLVAASTCDSIVTTNLIILPTFAATDSISACTGDSVFLAGMYQTISGTYVDTVAAVNTCDSVITTVLTIVSAINDTVVASLCDGDSLFVGGAFQTATGNYIDSLTAQAGCDSVVVTLLTVYPTYNTNDTLSICQGDSAFLAGIFQTMAGSYVDSLFSQNNCDSVVTTLLNVVQAIRDTVSADICDGDSLFAGGGFQTISGTYADTLQAGGGCDSIVTTLLTVLPNSQQAVATSICDGDSLFLGGGFQTLSGVFLDTLPAANGCDSVITTTLTVLPNSFTALSESICAGDSFFVGGGFQTTSGTYMDTLASANACDSVITTTLAVLPNSATTVTTSICDGDSIFLAGMFQTTAGTFTDTLIAANTCDSVVTTNLNILPTFATNDTLSICQGDSIFLGGGFQSTSGSYIDVLQSQASCDSTVTTLLNVVTAIRDTVSADICDGDSLFAGGGFQTISGTYADTLQAGGGCDSIVTTLLTVLPNSQDAVATSICDGDSLFVGGAFQTLSGVFLDTLPAANGCDSVITTTLTVLPNSFTALSESICAGDSFFVGGGFQTISGLYMDTLGSANSCDSIVTTTLTVLPNSATTVTTSICDGDSIFLAGMFQTTSGTFTDTLVAVNTCDSVVTTNLSILPTFATNDTLSICQGDSIFLGGAFQSTAGSYVDVLQSQVNCDSTVTTLLQIIAPINVADTATICQGDSIFLGGIFQTTAGSYIDTLVAANSCDSIVTTALFVLPTSSSSATASICQGDSVFIGGVFQTTSGVYTDTLVAVNSCDSVVTTTLTVLPNSFTNLTVAICDGDSFFVGGTWQFVSGSYADTLLAANSCDSIVTTALTVNPVFAINATADICDGDSILLGGIFQTVAGTYVDSLMTINGCDSIISTVLTVNPAFSSSATASICNGDSILLAGIFQTISGTYVDSLLTMNGCDSIITTTLTVLPNSSTTLSPAICAGDSIFAGGGWQTTSGTYVDVFTAANGCDSTISTVLTVNTLPPAPTITPPGPLSICPGDSVQITSSATSGNTWIPGGQTTQSIFANAAGQYSVTFTDANNCTSPASSPVTVNTFPLAAANFSFVPNQLNVAFTDLSSGNPNSWNWDFGDGQTSTQQNTNNSYAAPGTYTVCLIADNGCGPDTLCQQVTVSCTAPVAAFTYGSANLTVFYTNQTSPTATSYSWDFGDGQTSSQVSPTHTYTNGGIYTVCLIANSVCGNDTVCQTVNVNCPAPVANFTYNGNLTQMTFADASTNAPTSWSWDFGDGGTSAIMNPAHAYAGVGVYQVCLTVSNGCGTDSTCQFVSVMVGSPEASLPQGWALYPNPTEGTFFLDGDRSAGRVLRMTVVDLPGQILIDQRPGDQGGRWQAEFDLSPYSRGVYILRVETTKGTWATRVMRR